MSGGPIDSQLDDGGLDKEIAMFLRGFSEPGFEPPSSDLWDCLWRVSYPADSDALMHEFVRIGLDAPAWRRLEAERKAGAPLLKNMRDGLVEVLTDLYFPGHAVWQSDAAKIGEELLQGLVATFQQSGALPEDARARAVTRVHDLIRHPERYEELREHAGYKAGQDSDTSSSDFPVIPVSPIPGECPSSDESPLIPEDLYLDLEDGVVEPPEGGEPSDAVFEPLPEEPAAGERKARIEERAAEHDSWHHRSFRFKSEQ